MNKENRTRKKDIKYDVELNPEQREAKSLIVDNQVVIVTGVAGTGKSLVCAQAALDFLNRKQIEEIFVTRAAIEVGKSLGYLPGSLEEKFNPYLEGFRDNLYKCYDKIIIDQIVREGKVKALPVQFIRGKTIDDLLIVEEAQNLTKHEILALLTRLGKTGKIIINGDNEQKDIKEQFTGLSYAIELSKNIPEIKWIKLKENHRSGLVGKILDYEHKT